MASTGKRGSESGRGDQLEFSSFSSFYSIDRREVLTLSDSSSERVTDGDD